MYKYRLYQRPPSALWWVGIGRKIRKPTQTTDKAAAVLYAQALAEQLYQVEKLGQRDSLPFGDTAEKWLIDSARQKTADRHIVDWLLGRAKSNLLDEDGDPVPNLTTEPLSAVATTQVWDALRAHGKALGWTLASIDRMMTTVSAVLNFARKRGDMGKDAPRITLPKYRPKLREPRFLTPAQFARLCEELPPHAVPWAQFAVLTLLRMRAMLGLTWDRVDLGRRVAWIPMDEQKGGQTFQFPLSTAAVALLEAVRAAQAAEYAAYRARHAARYARAPSHPSHAGGVLPYPAHVFTYQLKPVGDANGAAFKAAARRAEVPWCTWHMLRHTGASWGAQGGVTLDQRMRQGDWKDPRMALRYSHLEASHVAAAAEVVAQMWHSPVIVKSPSTPKKPVKSRDKVWSHGGSNPGPLPCHGGGLVKNQRLRRG
jgi:integrase